MQREYVSGRKLSKDEAIKTLRTVTPDKAFHFYKEIAKPLGSSSKSLAEFAEMVKGIDASSVKFHIERGDFESWFKMLGDYLLASQVASMRGRYISPEELRAKVSSTVRSRVSQLQKIAGQNRVVLRTIRRE